MAVLSDYVSGMITLTNGSVDFTGTGTAWQLAQIREGDTIFYLPGTAYQGVISEITSNVAGKLERAWEGPDLTDVAYRIRILSDGSRSTSQSAMLREQLGNGNIQAVAGLTGSADQVLMFTAPGAMTTVPKSSLVSGADYDVQVDDVTGRAVYDGQTAGFTVLISDMGDGRAAIQSKASNTSADWTDPAYVTGAQGGQGDQGDQGPAGEGFEFKGAYSGATAYVEGDVVRDAGSSWIALQGTTGNAPPTLPTTSNAYWELLAQKGADGAGTIASLVEGDGISIDDSDPANPIISAEAQPLNLVAGDGIAIDDSDPTAPVISIAHPTYDPNISILALEIADLKGIRLGMAGGIADPFDSENGVDTAASINESYDAGADLYSPSATAGAALTATHTSATQSGNTVSASTTLSGRPAYRAFDKVTPPSQWTSDSVATGWVQYAFAVAKIVGSYSWRCVVGFSDRAPSAWTLQASNTGAFAGEQVTLDTRSGITGWGSGETKSFQVSSPASYLYYRIVVSANNGSAFLEAEEIEFYQPDSINNMTLISNAILAPEVPTVARAAVQVVENVGVVVNSDLAMAVSRDGGASWSAATLSLSAVNSAVKLYEDASIDISGQPSGTSMKWRVQTLNGKDIDVSGIVLQWL